MTDYESFVAQKLAAIPPTGIAGWTPDRAGESVKDGESS